MYIVIILIYFIWIYIRIVFSCVSHSNDEVSVILDPTHQGLDGKKCHMWSDLHLLPQWQNISHRIVIQSNTKTEQMVILNVSRFIITLINKRHLKWREWEMDRRKCQHGTDKVFESKEINVRGENWRKCT